MVAARFLHIAALILLFGAALFPLYAGRRPEVPKTLRVAGILLSLIGGVAWLAFTTSAITGSISIEALNLIVRNTSFGALWLVRLVVLTFVLLPLVFIPGRTDWTNLAVLTFLL